MKLVMKKAALGLLICLLAVSTSGCSWFGDSDDQRGGVEIGDVTYLVPDGVTVNWVGGEKIGENEYKLKVGEEAYPQFPKPYSTKMANNRMMFYRESSFQLSGASGVAKQPISDWGKVIGVSPGTVTMTCTYDYLRQKGDGGGSVPVSVDVVFHIVDGNGNLAPTRQTVQAIPTTRKTAGKITVASTQSRPPMTTVPITTATTTTTAPTTTTTAPTTTTAATAFVPVTEITGVPAAIIERQTVTLQGTVKPQNATEKQIVWSIVSGENYKVSLRGNRLTGLEASAVGTHPVIRATIKDGRAKGKDYVQDFEIEVKYSS